MKVITIVGARPQFVKAAVVSRALKNKGAQEIIVHTGQHFDAGMSDVFFAEMDIPKPKYNLDIHGLGHGAMTGRMMEGIEEILLDEKPQCLLVYGDTNSTLAGALTARKLNIPVAHVEAGLRSFNMEMPEEINRILTDRISDVLFTPTEQADKNLKDEGYDFIGTQVNRVGDVMQDAAIYYAQKLDDKPSNLPSIPQEYCLATVHRAENTDSEATLRAIFRALDQINTSVAVVLPLHPRTKAKLAAFGITTACTLIDPVGYFDMIRLLQNCNLVLTDSGGLQKEAYFFQKPCITLREQTEWVELVEKGYNLIAGSDQKAIVDAFEYFRENELEFSNDLYGGGEAGDRIAEEMSRLYA